MVQARYSFGWFGIIVPGVFNLLSMMGYSILNAILAGQTLSVVSGGKMSWNVGIVVISLISLLISFFGYRILNWYERVAWFPVLVMYLVVLGVGGRHLMHGHEEAPLAPAKSVLSFGATVAAFIISYAALMSDYTNYMRVDVASWRVFLFSYLGLLLPTASIQLVGAAFAASLPSNPSWQAGYDAAGIGGLIDAVLSPTNGFGKFLTVLLALSVIANMSPTLYSFGISSQVVLPFTARLPRYVFSIAGTGILIPLAIVGSTRFEETLVDFLGLVGYWSSTFVAVIAVEHVVIRKRDWSAYDISAWNAPRRLPPGIAALGACVCTFGLIVPCMDQVWFTGPIAKTTGDIGFEVGLFLTGMVYVPLRRLERRVFGR
ncbi:Purine-cytosine permease fcyB [Rhizoctonia solani]|uniref:Purine-cytosine permease fcyB n=1 Tax=Rhizoctonia solani TaxID=456999 RepID=A0A0K6G215_9AGAM|nr:Purine-cytosine permease fcyB [Rhizoctonia solani]